jgi:hypothetical protein
MDITLAGQALTQIPQPTHFSLSTLNIFYLPKKHNSAFWQHKVTRSASFFASYVNYES